MTNDYVIVVPSYKRAAICNAKTLSTLHQLGIPKERINVFVVKEEYNLYLSTLNPLYYNQLVIGVKGLVQQRRFIELSYPEGTRIVSIDDDIQSLNLTFSQYKSADELFTAAFEECDKQNCFLFGLYPCNNPLILQRNKEITSHLTFIIGAFYGFINQPHDEALALTISPKYNGNKEDVERSIKYFLRDGKVLRFNRVSFKTKYYGKDGGGLGTLNDRIIPMREATLEILEAYSKLTRKKVRPNGLYEVVFPSPKGVTICISKAKQIKSEEIEPPIQLPELTNPEDYLEVYNLLCNTTVKLNSNKSGRLSFGKHRSMVLGFIKARVTRVFGLSYESKRNPELYQAVLELGKKICPFEFNAIHINEDVVCPRHLDPGNVGKSLLLSLGDYNGCNLVIENYGEYNTNCKPIVFDGSSSWHYNTPLLSGKKYSLVYFTSPK
jgi:hypothetical protein